MALLYMCFHDFWLITKSTLSHQENTMLARTPSTFRLIGAGVTSVGALAAIFGSGGSNAQTLANLDTDPDRIAHIERDCGHIRDPDLKLGCVAKSSIEYSRAHAELMRKEAAEHRAAREAAEKRIAEHQKAAGAARTEAQCLSDITAALREKRIVPADVRAAKANPTASDDPCVWRGRLQPRLGELTKQ
jgi:hypothetical protein